MQYQFDVVVCGAGPAGTSASLFLSKQGIQHLLLDQAAFPRPKVCGDGITPVCITILEQVIPGIQEHFSNNKAINRIRYLRVYAPNGKFADLKTADYEPPGKDNLYTIGREYFDDYLLQKACEAPETSFWDNCRVKSFTQESDGVTIQAERNREPITIIAKMVIAADGDRSIFRKHIAGTAIKRQHMVAAIRAYYKNVKPVSDADRYEVFAFKEVLPGYFWIFPMADGSYNVGLGITSDVIQQKKLNLKKLLGKLTREHPMLKERFEKSEIIGTLDGSGLPIMLENKPLVSAERILLTGDAASLADPVTGEGIGPALISGKYAALAAGEALQQNNFAASFLHNIYDTMIHKKVTDAYQLRITLFDWFVKHPFKINWLIQAAPKIGLIRNFFANSVNGRFSVKDLKNPAKWRGIFSGVKG